MIDVNQLRRGVTFTHDNDLYKVLEYTHNKPARGKATIKVQIRNLRTGGTREKTFNSGEKIQNIRMDTDVVEYLYPDGEFLVFMNIETYDQPQLRKDVFGDDFLYLTENMELKLSTYEGEIIDYTIPTTVEHKVVESEMAVAGDTATGATKYVITESGLKVTVPMFVEVGSVIRINTESGDYITRV